MGNFFAKIMERLQGVQQRKIVMVGLDAAGKTTVLYKLRLGEQITTIPTIGFNVENLRLGTLEFQVWDIGGQDKIRPLWKHYYAGTDAIIFVLDSSDKERMRDAKHEVEMLIGEDELKDAALLVLANKQDLPGAGEVSDIAEQLGLKGLRRRQWFIQGAVATKGVGLYEGLDWLARTLNDRRRR